MWRLIVPGPGSSVAGEPEQMRALVVGQPQRPRDRREHRRGWALRAPLLEPREVVERHSREPGDLFAP